MSANHGTLPAATALAFDALVTPTPHGIASRVLAKAAGGTVTLLAFDAGESLSEHTAPFDALVHVLGGSFTLTIGGTAVEAPAGAFVRLPAGVPHAVEAAGPSRMVLTMLREAAG